MKDNYDIDSSEIKELLERFFPYHGTNYETYLRNLLQSKKIESKNEYCSFKKLMLKTRRTDYDRLNTKLREKINFRITELNRKDKKKKKEIKAKLTDSDFLILYRFNQFFMNDLSRLLFLTSAGFYDLVEREMRYILEYFVNAYVVDKTYEKENLQVKIGRIKDHYDSQDGLFGKKLYDKLANILQQSGENTAIVDRMYKLQEKMSGKIHASLQEAAEITARYASDSKYAMFHIPFHNDNKYRQTVFLLHDIYGYIVRLLERY